MIETFFGFFIAAVFVEGTVEYIFGKDGKSQPWVKYVALLIGALLAIAYGLDLFAQLGLVSTIPYIGQICTGVIIGRGSNYLNDFISRIKNPRPSVVVESPATVNTAVANVDGEMR